MDFKVAGTEKGVCAIQMDIKISGINKDIIEKALAQAHKGREEIRLVMNECINEPREDVSRYAPKLAKTMIPVDKIKEVIGPGGKKINEIIAECDNVKIDIEQDGRVFVMHAESEWIEKAIAIISDIVREPEVGKIYPVKVVKIMDFGAFCELWPGCEGLCHISALDTKRVNKVEDVVHEGDEIVVKLLKIDEKGKLVLSRKVLLQKPEEEKQPKEETKETAAEEKVEEVVVETPAEEAVDQPKKSTRGRKKKVEE